MQNLTLPHMYSKMLCLNNWDVFIINRPERTAPLRDNDAAETVRFSWKVVGLKGQREHDVRRWPISAMDGNRQCGPVVGLRKHHFPLALHIYFIDG